MVLILKLFAFFGLKILVQLDFKPKYVIFPWIPWFNNRFDLLRGPPPSYNWWGQYSVVNLSIPWNSTGRIPLTPTLRNYKSLQGMGRKRGFTRMGTTFSMFQKHWALYFYNTPLNSLIKKFVTIKGPRWQHFYSGVSRSGLPSSALYRRREVLHLGKQCYTHKTRQAVWYCI